MQSPRGKFVIPERVRRSLLAKSRKDRMFFDNLVLLVWCECKGGVRKGPPSIDDWADIQLPCYSTGQCAIMDSGIKMAFNTPRNKLSRPELKAVQEFIRTHVFIDVAQAKREIAANLMNDCAATALNVIDEIKSVTDGKV